MDYIVDVSSRIGRSRPIIAHCPESVHKELKQKKKELAQHFTKLACIRASNMHEALRIAFRLLARIILTQIYPCPNC